MSIQTFTPNIKTIYFEFMVTILVVSTFKLTH